MGDKLLLIPYFDNFDFQCTLFPKNPPKFWRSIPNQAGTFLDLWHCMFSTKLSYTQLFKWGYSNAGNKIDWYFGVIYYRLTHILFLCTYLQTKLENSLRRLKNDVITSVLQYWNLIPYLMQCRFFFPWSMTPLLSIEAGHSIPAISCLNISTS